MIEQLLSFFAMIMGLEIKEPNVEYFGSGIVIESGFDYEINYQEIQKQIIIEDYFLFLDRLGRINYARGCAGEATPPQWNGEKWVRCGIKSFDCGGLMKYYGRIKGIIDRDELVYLRSDTLYGLGVPKDPRTAERGDFMYRKGFGKAEGETHFAVVSSGYDDKEHSMYIYDNANGKYKNQTGERKIKVTCNEKQCWYIGMYRIYISTNGMVELANKKGIQVNAFKILDNDNGKETNEE